MKTPKILVVDDDKNVLLLVRVNLELEGFDVREACDGRQALEMIAKERPDLVLLDIMMPKVDGWEVLQSIVEDPETADIPVIMLTAKTQEEDQLRGWSSGAVEYITKPFNPLALVQIVKNVLSKEVEGDREHRRLVRIQKLEALKRLRDQEL